MPTGSLALDRGLPAVRSVSEESSSDVSRITAMLATGSSKFEFRGGHGGVGPLPVLFAAQAYSASRSPSTREVFMSSGMSARLGKFSKWRFLTFLASMRSSS